MTHRQAVHYSVTLNQHIDLLLMHPCVCVPTCLHSTEDTICTVGMSGTPENGQTMWNGSRDCTEQIAGEIATTKGMFLTVTCLPIPMVMPGYRHSLCAKDAVHLPKKL